MEGSENTGLKMGYLGTFNSGQWGGKTWGKKSDKNKKGPESHSNTLGVGTEGVVRVGTRYTVSTAKGGAVGQKKGLLFHKKV